MPSTPTHLVDHLLEGVAEGEHGREAALEGEGRLELLPALRVQLRLLRLVLRLDALDLLVRLRGWGWD